LRGSSPAADAGWSEAASLAASSFADVLLAMPQDGGEFQRLKKGPRGLRPRRKP